jgi:hypothetical protein
MSTDRGNDARRRVRPADWLVIEGIVTTRNEDGTTNIAPMGPIVEPGLERLVLRPYRTATTYTNLRRTGEGVFHVTDDVELLARAAVGRIEQPPKTIAAARVDGEILAGACRWYAFRVSGLDDHDERSWFDVDVVERGTFREFIGFNRAKHAVLEAAILATRARFLSRHEVRRDYDRLAAIVDKTGGAQERRAFELLYRYVRESASRGPND